jgi:hypothetical protein
LKLHEIKHIARFIVAFGGSRGYNASRPEEHHKAHAKRPGCSQKSAKTIDQQCARSITDTCIIDTMNRLFNGDQPGGFTGNNTQDFGTGEGNKQEPRTVEEGPGTWNYRRSFRDPKDDNQVLHKAGFHRQTKGPINLKQNIAYFILQSYSKSDLDVCGEDCIQFCKEYHKCDVDHGGETFISLCCLCNCRGKVYWYDWAIIATENDDRTPWGIPIPNTELYPHMLLMVRRGMKQKHLTWLFSSVTSLLVADPFSSLSCSSIQTIL